MNLEIPDEEHEKLPKWDKMSEAERTAYLEYFSELMPAPFEPMSIRDKIGFLKQIGINSKADLYSFGAREN